MTSETKYLYHHDCRDLLLRTLEDFAIKECKQSYKLYALLDMDVRRELPEENQKHLRECLVCTQMWNSLQKKLSQVDCLVPRYNIRREDQLELDQNIKMLVSKVVWPSHAQRLRVFRAWRHSTWRALVDFIKVVIDVKMLPWYGACVGLYFALKSF